VWGGGGGGGWGEGEGCWGVVKRRGEGVREKGEGGWCGVGGGVECGGGDVVYSAGGSGGG